MSKRAIIKENEYFCWQTFKMLSFLSSFLVAKIHKRQKKCFSALIYDLSLSAVFIYTFLDEQLHLFLKRPQINFILRIRNYFLSKRSNFYMITKVKRFHNSITKKKLNDQLFYRLFEGGIVLRKLSGS